MHRFGIVVLIGSWTLVTMIGGRGDGADVSEGKAKSAEAKRVRWANAAPAASSLYRVQRMKDNSTIDAEWTKAAWKNIPPVTLEYYMGGEPEHQPKTQAKAAYDDTHIYLIWRVEDNYLLAKRTRHQQDVCRDSCVEFFFTPVNDPANLNYFNLETNCTGVKLFEAHVTDGKNEGLKPEEFGQIVTASSLTKPIDPEIATPTTWTVEYKIPFDLVTRFVKIDHPKPGVKWRGNFYKCADESSHPHWLTWSPIHNDHPAFHVPKDFGTLLFE